jgi:hypothetical protein
MSTIIEQVNNSYNFEEFKQFINTNGILSTAAGVIIAYAAWDLIKSLVGDILLPSVYFICIHPFLEKEIVSLIFAPIEKINIPNFTKTAISFAIMLIITFVGISYITNNWIDTKKAQIGTTLFTNKATPIHPTRLPISQTPVSKTDYEAPYMPFNPIQ